MHALLSELFPFNRSITGEGVKKTIARISKEIPLVTHSIASGTSVFGWTVPKEWNVSSAKLFDPNGNIIADYDDNNLFLMSYSQPVSKTLTLSELLEHIISDPTRPNSIPYSTSYYSEGWSFCLPYNIVKNLIPGNYRVEIDSSFTDGELNYAEAFIDNKAQKTVLVSSYICHPSMANDSLSGVVLAIELFKRLKESNSLNYNYRFVFAPETIGTICFLFNNRDKIKNQIEYGLVATCVGDAGKFTYKMSRKSDSKINKLVKNIFKKKGMPNQIIPFSPLGSDERQYCSPGFDLEVGVLTRSMYGTFPEYHTSDDNLSFVTDKALEESLRLYLEIINSYEANRIYSRIDPYCEPQMSKYNLYRSIGGAGQDNLDDLIQQRMWVLNYSDSQTDLLTISDYSSFDILQLKKIADELVMHNLIKEV